MKIKFIKALTDLINKINRLRILFLDFSSVVLHTHLKHKTSNIPFYGPSAPSIESILNPFSPILKTVINKKKNNFLVCCPSFLLTRINVGLGEIFC